MFAFVLILHTATATTTNTTNEGTKTLHMLGDSTIRHQFEYICSHGTGFNSKQANGTRYKECVTLGLRILTPQKYSDWGSTSVESTSHFVRSFAAHTMTSPDFMCFNGGLHCLQLIPCRKWGLSRKNAHWIWLNAEEIIARFLSETREDFPSLGIIFMTSHSICENKFTGAYQTALQEIRNNATQFARECVLFLEQKELGCRHTNRCIDKCRQSTFNNHGVSLLNRRAQSVLPPSVHVLDAYRLTKGACNHTKRGDGRHYDNHALQKEMNALEALIGFS